MWSPWHRSSCGSDTGDVLIRSTRVPLPQDRRPGSVQITVQKLREPPRPQPPLTGQQPPLTGQQQPPLTEQQQRDSDAPPRAADDPDPGEDLLTSRYAAGDRGAVLEALKQRSHSAPCRREVTVQLLDTPTPSSCWGTAGQAELQVEAGLSCGRHGDADSTTAAAALTAATAPLLKAQLQVEARVSQLADGVQQLLQVDREGGARGWSLHQQVLQQLESQQLQSQLLQSALRIVTGHAPGTSDLTASGQQAQLQVTHLDTAASRAAAAAAAVETNPVAMETHHRDRWPEQTRDEQSGTHLQPSSNHSAGQEEVMRTANQVLREVRRLRTEMNTLLTPEEPLNPSTTAPDHIQSQQNQSQKSQSHQNQSQQSQFLQNQSQSQQNQSYQTQPHQNYSQSQQNQFQQNQHCQSQENSFQSQFPQSHPKFPQYPYSLFHRTRPQRPRSVLVQRTPVVPSPLEEAAQVLRRVQRQRKVLEENLEVLLRSRPGDVLQLEAANRDLSEKVRVRRTVDTWIRDIQAEMTSEDAVHHTVADAAVTSQQRAAGSSTHTGKGRVRGSRGGAAGRGALQGAEPNSTAGRLTDGERAEADGESYLNRLYGRAPYDGLRRTLKKSPYLRFSSPASPLSRRPRPRLVESVRGVKLKSCKTQTCLAPPLTVAPPFILSPGRHQHHPVFSSSPLTPGDPADLTVPPVTMAIPLGRPRMDSSSKCEGPREVTSPPMAPPTASVVALDDGAPEKQPPLTDEAPPPPPSNTRDVMERRSNEEEEEENIFPGTDFLTVADIIQEEVTVEEEKVLEVDGGPSPPPVLYQGPVFPPQAPSALLAQDQGPILDIDPQQDALENRLVEWVEQQLMSRMISYLYCPPPSDPAHNHHTDQSELEERSATSDIVEAAGGAGLQVFVDSNIPVDSDLIRQLVHEVLTETVVLMLGQRDVLDPGPAARQEEVPLVPTPVPTPPPTPAPPTRDTSAPVTTPPPSEPTSPLSVESPQPITAPEPIATPTPSPEPAPSAGSPSAPPPLTLRDAELPLDEERAEEHLDTHYSPEMMSVVEEEPPLSSPAPPPPSLPHACPPSPPLGPGPEPGPEPGPVSPSSSSSSDSSSVTVETEAALRHISEGELLLSISHRAAMTEEDAGCSFSSSLQDMDFDPPSEGQVKGRDLLLMLLTKMEQGAARRGERPQPEGAWGSEDQEEEEEVSVGEVRRHWTTERAGRGRPSSPGQMSRAADVGFESTNQGAFSTLTSDLHTDLSLSPPPPPHLERTHTAGQVLLVQQYHTLSAGRKEAGGGARRTEEEEEEVMEEVMEEEVSAAADSSSSSNNVF